MRYYIVSNPKETGIQKFTKGINLRKWIPLLVIGAIGIWWYMQSKKKAEATPTPTPTGPENFVYSDVSAGYTTISYAPGWLQPAFTCMIKNTGSEGSRNVTFSYVGEDAISKVKSPAFQETIGLKLKAGESAKYVFNNMTGGTSYEGYPALKIIFGRDENHYMWLEDNKGGRSEVKVFTT